MSKHFAEELAVNMFFLAILLFVLLLFLPEQSLARAWQNCALCTDWASEFRQFGLVLHALFSEFVFVLRSLGRFAGGVPVVW
ncbi:MAG: hypothetical protein KF753_15560 [Caldilineaceae bacterium]|nr:hypothetical protein [Caldilineaceae bacterium]